MGLQNSTLHYHAYDTRLTASFPGKPG